MDAWHELYNVICLRRHEVVLFYTCFLYLYLPSDWVWPCWRICYNNVAHLYSAVAHDLYMCRNTLLPWSCLRLCCEYDNHEVLQNYYMFQKYDLLFWHTFCFAHCNFGIWVVPDDYDAKHSMLTRKNKEFLQICNTHRYMLPCTVKIYYSVGVAECYIV